MRDPELELRLDLGRLTLGCIDEREDGHVSGIPARRFGDKFGTWRKRQTSRRHLIFGPAIGTFEDDHRFTAQKDPVPGIAADRVFLLGKSIIKESPEYP